MKKIVSCVVGFGLVALVLSGCATAPAAQAEPDGPAPEPTTGSTTTFTDGLLTYRVINVEGTLVGHMGSLLEGTLTFDNGCLLVADHPVVFPADTTSWDGTTLTANGNEFFLGDKISVGGGAPPDATLPENTPDQCEGMAPWYASGAEAPSEVPGSNVDSPRLLSARIIASNQDVVATMKGSITVLGGCIAVTLDDGASVPAVWPEYGQVAGTDPHDLVWPNGRLQVGQDLPHFNGFYAKTATLGDVAGIHDCIDTSETHVLVVTGVNGLILEQ